MHFVTGELRFIVPANDRAINTASKDQQLFQVEGTAHDIVFVDNDAWEWDILASNVVSHFLITTSSVGLSGRIIPLMQLLAPADG